MGVPSTVTCWMAWQSFGEIVNVWLPPQGTVIPPLGEIEAPASELALMEYGPSVENVALIAWLVMTFVNVYVDSAPRGTPSTVTPAIA